MKKHFGMKCYRYEDVIGVYVVAIKKKNIGKQIFVNYGYADDISKAQILRSPNEKQVAVSLPQKPKKALVRETRNIPGITLVENEIFVQIYKGVDLTIQRANIDSIKEAHLQMIKD
ncbi:2925_t:CDS:2 [Gigaspora margarita]|uniref:2925_t:CDS:1 n=1 Tax=Gigaspora margarita TaxID=4874 RepID=A0ABN7WA71_GIGMA|nr:2925_t:CDS:2 [Gigaspora margarita]